MERPPRQERLKGLQASLLCLSLACPAPLPAQTAAKPKPRPIYKSNQLHGDERILHALDRFTFGPRPGDLEAVRAMGLDAWFKQQLHPDSLDRSDLNARLAAYPAMQLPTQDLLHRFPSYTLIAQAVSGRLELPNKEPLQAIYRDQMDRLIAKRQQRVQKQVALQAQVASPAVIAMPAQAMTAPTEADRTDSPNPLAKSPAVSMAEPTDANTMAEQNSSPAVPSQAEINTLLDLPADQRLARLASMPQPQLDAFFKVLRPLERVQLAAGLSPEQKEYTEALENPERVVAEELVAQRLTHDLYSTAQLQEVMTDFWLNHFNIYLRKNETMPYELVSFERDVIRPHALGKFEDLLEATAHSPAMLLYLDNVESIGPNSIAAGRAQLVNERRPVLKKIAPRGLNENYARELMELHTVGVNGGYTQADVTEVARILTGWTVDRPLRGGSFQFEPNRHEPGTRKVLGQKFKDDGELEGRALLHYLVTRPAAAQFLSHKLAVRFVSDYPPPELVDRMAKTYLATGGDISAVLRTLFRSPEFWSRDAYRAKVKTPLEYVVSSLRASNATVDNLRPVANALRQMGMPLYGCVPPSGYDWKSSAWVSTGALVDRMNFALNLAANHLPGIAVSWSQPTGAATDAFATAEQEEARLEPLLIAGTVSDATRAAVLEQFRQQNQQAQRNTAAKPGVQRARVALGTSPLERQDQLLAGLLLGSPEFQRR